MKYRAFAPIVASLALAAIVVTASTLFALPWLPRMGRLVMAYDAAAATLLIWYWAVLLRTNSAGTKARAAAQDPGRDAVFAVILVAVIFGFFAAFAILGRGPRDRVPEHELVTYALGFGAVAMGWFLIHTIYSFRYAHLYYRDRGRSPDPSFPLKFPGNTEPDYTDFAYFSFVLGMTFQVSDVEITGQRIRRLALGHGLISFGYNTAILALVVNVVSNLLH
jgi:uncharacterized membrane protein